MKKVMHSLCCAVITSVALAYDVIYTYDASDFLCVFGRDFGLGQEYF